MTEKSEPRTQLTAAQVEAWVGEVEDKTWSAKAEASACRFLLGNLLVELQGMGLMDAGEFISRLRLALPPDMDNAQARLGVADLLDDLQLFFHQPKSTEGAGNPGGVFH